MNIKRLFLAVATGFFTALPTLAQTTQTNLTTLTQWNFNGSNSLSPSFGSGTCWLLGGLTNSVASGSGSSDPLGTGDRALGLAGFPAATNVTANAGIEFRTSTVGFSNILFQFDLRASSTASGHLQTFYSVDQGNSYFPGPIQGITHSNAFTNRLTLDLTGFDDATDHPDLRIRLVSVVGESGRYEGVSSPYSPAGVWRLDWVTFFGVELNPRPPIVPVAAPTVVFTNRISGRVHLGEPTVHSHSELVLRPGESLRLSVAASDSKSSKSMLTLEAADQAGPPSGSWKIAEAKATYTYTALESDAGHLFRIGLHSGNGAATNRTSWTLYVPTVAERAIVISEFLADPPARSPGTNATVADPLGRTGSVLNPPASEFVELLNTGVATLDLTGWTLGDATATVRHRFGTHAGVSLARWNAWVIYGGPRTGAVPVLAASAYAASSGGLSLNNGGDAITLRNAHSNLIERIEYRGASLGSGSSLVRVTIPDGEFRPSRSVGELPWSPGTDPQGGPWPQRTTSGTTTHPLVLKIAQLTGGQIRISWEVGDRKPCWVRRGATLEGPFEDIASGVVTGEFLDSTSDASAYYRVEGE